jgi:hypothetical protein
MVQLGLKAGSPRAFVEAIGRPARAMREVDAHDVDGNVARTSAAARRSSAARAGKSRNRRTSGRPQGDAMQLALHLDRSAAITPLSIKGNKRWRHHRAHGQNVETSGGIVP